MTERKSVPELYVYADKLVGRLESALVKARRIYELGLEKRGPMIAEELAEARHLARQVNEDLSHASDAAGIVKYVIDRAEKRDK